MISTYAVGGDDPSGYRVTHAVLIVVDLVIAGLGFRALRGARTRRPSAPRGLESP